MRQCCACAEAHGAQAQVDGIDVNHCCSLVLVICAFHAGRALRHVICGSLHRINVELRPLHGIRTDEHSDERMPPYFGLCTAKAASLRCAEQYQAGEALGKAMPCKAQNGMDTQCALFSSKQVGGQLTSACCGGTGPNATMDCGCCWFPDLAGAGLGPGADMGADAAASSRRRAARCCCCCSSARDTGKPCMTDARRRHGICWGSCCS